jgi:hypothetical protein
LPVSDHTIMRVNGLIAISATPPVVWLSDVGCLRERTAAGEEAEGELAGLVGECFFASAEIRAVFETMIRTLAF